MRSISNKKSEADASSPLSQIADHDRSIFSLRGFGNVLIQAQHRHCCAVADILRLGGVWRVGQSFAVMGCWEDGRRGSVLIVGSRQQVIAVDQRDLRRRLLLIAEILVGDALVEDDQTASIEANDLMAMVIAVTQDRCRGCRRRPTAVG